jgi:putative lipoic acid-binding regulatory protein
MVSSRAELRVIYERCELSGESLYSFVSVALHWIGSEAPDSQVYLFDEPTFSSRAPSRTRRQLVEKVVEAVRAHHPERVGFAVRGSDKCNYWSSETIRAIINNQRDIDDLLVGS